MSIKAPPRPKSLRRHVMRFVQGENQTMVLDCPECHRLLAETPFKPSEQPKEAS